MATRCACYKRNEAGPDSDQLCAYEDSMGYLVPCPESSCAAKCPTNPPTHRTMMVFVPTPEGTMQMTIDEKGVKVVPKTIAYFVLYLAILVVAALIFAINEKTGSVSSMSMLLYTLVVIGGCWWAFQGFPGFSEFRGLQGLRETDLSESIYSD